MTIRRITIVDDLYQFDDTYNCVRVCQHHDLYQFGDPYLHGFFSITLNNKKSN